MLECYGKMELTLTRSCAESPMFSPESTIWTLVGFTLITHMVLMETVIFMGVLISCAILLHATLDVERTEVGEEPDDFSHVRQADLANITNMAEEISKFIGEVLIGYLIYHATTTPKVIRNLFFKKAIVFVSGVINNGPIVVALVVGSLASLRVMRTKNVQKPLFKCKF